MAFRFLCLRGRQSPLLLTKNGEMQDVKDQISKLVEEALPDDRYFLVDVLIKGNKGAQKVQVFVDGDHGIGIGVCSNISKHLSRQLDELDFVQGKYTLEVSSPGVDYSLHAERQFRKNIGRHLDVRSRIEKRFQGKLIDVNGKGIKLVLMEKKGKESEEKEIEIGFDEIEVAKVIVMFH